MPGTTPAGRPNLPERLAAHRAGRGARLISAVTAAGIDFTLARTWEGDRHRERQLKYQGGAARRCPACGETPAHEEGRLMPSKPNPRNHRNNPYALDAFAAQVHHSAAGSLFRFRTELFILLMGAAAFLALARTASLSGRLSSWLVWSWLPSRCPGLAGSSSAGPGA